MSNFQQQKYNFKIMRSINFSTSFHALLVAKTDHSKEK